MKCFDKTITLSCLLHNIRLFRGLNEKSTRLRAGSAFLFPVARSLDSRFDDLVGRGRGVASYYMANVGGGVGWDQMWRPLPHPYNALVLIDPDRRDVIYTQRQDGRHRATNEFDYGIELILLFF